MTMLRLFPEQYCVKQECGDDNITEFTIKTEEHETNIDTTNLGES